MEQDESRKELERQLFLLAGSEELEREEKKRLLQIAASIGREGGGKKREVHRGLSRMFVTTMFILLVLLVLLMGVSWVALDRLAALRGGVPRKGAFVRGSSDASPAFPSRRSVPRRPRRR